MNQSNLILRGLLVFLFGFMVMAFAPREGALPNSNHSSALSKDSLFSAQLVRIYDSCLLNQKGLSFSVFEKGMIGYYNLKNKQAVSSKNILTIVDFQKSSANKRLWVIDLKNNKVLFNTLVAHGRNTGEDKAINFSDTPNSYMSSLGFYYTGNTYSGKHGLSLVLEGLDKGFNSNAKDRSIVMHGAEYVCEEFVQCNGRLGRSQGCPALPVAEHKEIIKALEGGTVLFIHHPSPKYQSMYLDRNTAVNQFFKEDK